MISAPSALMFAIFSASSRIAIFSLRRRTSSLCDSFDISMAFLSLGSKISIFPFM